MIENPQFKLGTLKKGDCFMFNRQPYLIKRILWEDLEILKRKVWVCHMKFCDYDSHFLPNTEYYQISRGLYDLLVETEI